MRFSGPDHFLVSAWDALCAASVAKGIDLVDIDGISHGERCLKPGCRSTSYVAKPSRWGGVIERCARCGTPWAVLPASVQKGMVRTTVRPRRGTGPVVRAGDLLSVVGRVPTDTLRIYACWLIGGRGYAWTAETAREQGWPGGPWNENAVRRAVRRGRRWLQAELDASGLLRDAA